MEEKIVNNGVYLTFISEPEMEMPYKLNVFREKGISASQTDFTKYLYGENNAYLATYESLSKKQPINDDLKKYNIKNYYGIRPVLKTKGLMSDLIRQNATLISNDEVVLGSYPTKIVTDENLITSLKELKFNGKVYNVPIGENITPCQTISFNNEDYIYIKDKDLFVKVTFLTWYFDETSNSLISKDIIAAFYTSIGINDFEKYGYNFLNRYLIKDILKNNVISLTKPVDLINSNIYKNNLYSFSLPYDYDIDMDNDGKLYSHDEKEYNINVDESIQKMCINSLKYTFQNSYKDSPIFNITIKGDNKIAHVHAFDFTLLGINSKIHNLTIDSSNVQLENPMICVGGHIDNANIKCDLDYFAALFISGDVIGHNLLKSSNLTINYTSEKELHLFLNDMKKLADLLKKSALKGNHIYFGYKKVAYKCVSLDNKDYNFEANTLFDQIGLLSLTLKGPQINKEKIQKLIGDNENVIYNFDDNTLKELSNVKEDSSLSKEATHILDLTKEIVSIDYIGLDKDDVKRKVDAIIDEYNNLYSKKEMGLSLSTNNVLYTNTILKLENLKDALYHNYEKNINYYDILDLIDSMIKKLNNEEVALDYEILKDLDTLVNILKYSKDDNTKNEIISYLESEKQNIIDYLCNKKELDYNDINSFVKKFRLFLMPILTKVSGNVLKIDVLDNIKKYTINEMNNNSKERVDSYIKMILSQIDKVKEDILELDSNYTFEGTDYASFNTGKEIIDYLDNLYIKYYRKYLELYDDMQSQKVYERNLIPKIY